MLIECSAETPQQWEQSIKEASQTTLTYSTEMYSIFLESSQNLYSCTIITCSVHSDVLVSGQALPSCAKHVGE